MSTSSKSNNLKRLMAMLLSVLMLFSLSNLDSIIGEADELTPHEHHHNFACYENYWLACDYADVEHPEQYGHYHTYDCWEYDDTYEPLCQMEEGVEHTHNERHDGQGFTCKPVTRVLVCTMPEHHHTEECLAKHEEPTIPSEPDTPDVPVVPDTPSDTTEDNGQDNSQSDNQGDDQTGSDTGDDNKGNDTSNPGDTPTNGDQTDTPEPSDPVEPDDTKEPSDPIENPDGEPSNEANTPEEDTGSATDDVSVESSTDDTSSDSTTDDISATEELPYVEFNDNEDGSTTITLDPSILGEDSDESTEDFTEEYICGMEEHVHVDECFEDVWECRWNSQGYISDLDNIAISGHWVTTRKNMQTLSDDGMNCDWNISSNGRVPFEFSFTVSTPNIETPFPANSVKIYVPRTYFSGRGYSHGPTNIVNMTTNDPVFCVTGEVEMGPEDFATVKTSMLGLIEEDVPIEEYAPLNNELTNYRDFTVEEINKLIKTGNEDAALMDAADAELENPEQNPVELPTEEEDEKAEETSLTSSEELPYGINDHMDYYVLGNRVSYMGNHEFRFRGSVEPTNVIDRTVFDYPIYVVATYTDSSGVEKYETKYIDLTGSIDTSMTGSSLAETSSLSNYIAGVGGHHKIYSYSKLLENRYEITAEDFANYTAANQHLVEYVYSFRQSGAKAVDIFAELKVGNNGTLVGTHSSSGALYDVISCDSSEHDTVANSNIFTGYRESVTQTGSDCNDTFGVLIAYPLDSSVDAEGKHLNVSCDFTLTFKDTDGRVDKNTPGEYDETVSDDLSGFTRTIHLEDHSSITKQAYHGDIYGAAIEFTEYEGEVPKYVHGAPYDYATGALTLAKQVDSAHTTVNLYAVHRQLAVTGAVTGEGTELVTDPTQTAVMYASLNSLYFDDGSRESAPLGNSTSAKPAYQIESINVEIRDGMQGMTDSGIVSSVEEQQLPDSLASTECTLYVMRCGSTEWEEFEKFPLESVWYTSRYFELDYWDDSVEKVLRVMVEYPCAYGYAQVNISADIRLNYSSDFWKQELQKLHDRGQSSGDLVAWGGVIPCTTNTGIPYTPPADSWVGNTVDAQRVLDRQIWHPWYLSHGLTSVSEDSAHPYQRSEGLTLTEIPFTTGMALTATAKAAGGSTIENRDELEEKTLSEITYGISAGVHTGIEGGGLRHFMNYLVDSDNTENSPLFANGIVYYILLPEYTEPVSIRAECLHATLWEEYEGDGHAILDVSNGGVQNEGGTRGRVRSIKYFKDFNGTNRTLARVVVSTNSAIDDVIYDGVERLTFPITIRVRSVIGDTLSTNYGIDAVAMLLKDTNVESNSFWDFDGFASEVNYTLADNFPNSELSGFHAYMPGTWNTTEHSVMAIHGDFDAVGRPASTQMIVSVKNDSDDTVGYDNQGSIEPTQDYSYRYSFIVNRNEEASNIGIFSNIEDNKGFTLYDLEGEEVTDWLTFSGTPYAVDTSELPADLAKNFECWVTDHHVSEDKYSHFDVKSPADLPASDNWQRVTNLNDITSFNVKAVYFYFGDTRFKAPEDKELALFNVILRMHSPGDHSYEVTQEVVEDPTYVEHLYNGTSGWYTDSFDGGAHYATSSSMAAVIDCQIQIASSVDGCAQFVSNCAYDYTGSYQYGFTVVPAGENTGGVSASGTCADPVLYGVIEDITPEQYRGNLTSIKVVEKDEELTPQLYVCYDAAYAAALPAAMTPEVVKTSPWEPYDESRVSEVKAFALIIREGLWDSNYRSWIDSGIVTKRLPHIVLQLEFTSLDEYCVSTSEVTHPPFTGEYDLDEDRGYWDENNEWVEVPSTSFTGKELQHSLQGVHLYSRAFGTDVYKVDNKIAELNRYNYGIKERSFVGKLSRTEEPSHILFSAENGGGLVWDDELGEEVLVSKSGTFSIVESNVEITGNEPNKAYSGFVPAAPGTRYAYAAEMEIREGAYQHPISIMVPARWENETTPIKYNIVDVHVEEYPQLFLGYDENGDSTYKQIDVDFYVNTSLTQSEAAQLQYSPSNLEGLIQSGWFKIDPATFDGWRDVIGIACVPVPENNELYFGDRAEIQDTIFWMEAGIQPFSDTDPYEADMWATPLYMVWSICMALPEEGINWDDSREGMLHIASADPMYCTERREAHSDVYIAPNTAKEFAVTKTIWPSDMSSSSQDYTSWPEILGERQVPTTLFSKVQSFDYGIEASWSNTSTPLRDIVLIDDMEYKDIAPNVFKITNLEFYDFDVFNIPVTIFATENQDYSSSKAEGKSHDRVTYLLSGQNGWHIIEPTDFDAMNKAYALAFWFGSKDMAGKPGYTQEGSYIWDFEMNDYWALMRAVYDNSASIYLTIEPDLSAALADENASIWDYCEKENGGIGLPNSISDYANSAAGVICDKDAVVAWYDVPDIEITKEVAKVTRSETGVIDSILNWLFDIKVESDTEYSYRLKFQENVGLGDQVGQETTDIIIMDTIEQNDKPGEKSWVESTSQFHGVLKGIDLSSLSEAGIPYTLYVSEELKSKLDLQDTLTPEILQSVDSGWTRVTDVAGFDYSKVHSVAVWLGTPENGSWTDTTAELTREHSILLNMVMDTSSISSAAFNEVIHAYNNAGLRYSWNNNHNAVYTGDVSLETTSQGVPLKSNLRKQVKTGDMSWTDEIGINRGDKYSYLLQYNVEAGVAGVTFMDSIENIADSYNYSYSSLLEVTAPESITIGEDCTASFTATVKNISKYTLKNVVMSVDGITDYADVSFKPNTFELEAGASVNVGFNLNSLGPAFDTSMKISAICDASLIKGEASCRILQTAIVPGCVRVHFSNGTFMSKRFDLAEIIGSDFWNTISETELSFHKWDQSHLIGWSTVENSSTAEFFRDSTISASSLCSVLDLYPVLTTAEVKVTTDTGAIEYRNYSACAGDESILYAEVLSGVTYINRRAFYECKNLISIDIPVGVTYIGDYAFYGCSSLLNVVLPDGLSAINSGVFHKCTSLTNVDIPESVHRIYDAFSYCSSLISVHIPDGVPYIARQTFMHCTSLVNVTLPESITSIGSHAFYGCTSLSRIDIPSKVTDIDPAAFYGCSSLSSISVPDGITRIESQVFSNCSGLTSVSIPNSVTYIAGSAFSDCSSLIDIDIPDCVTYIGGGAFSGCSNLPTITIPNGVTSIECYTFSECHNLANINIPESITSIGKQAFYQCSKLTELIVPDNVAMIGEEAFSLCYKLKSVSLPSNLTSISDSLFEQCHDLVDVTLPSTVTSIGKKAFMFCESLTICSIPDTVTLIDDYAFMSCDSLRRIDLPDTITCLHKSVFSCCRNLVEISIPTSVTSIEDSALSSCESLKAITIPSGVTAIPNNCFSGCCSLKDVTIPQGVTSIGNSAFARCFDLKRLRIPKSVTSIGNMVFYDRVSLNDLYYGGSQSEWEALTVNADIRLWSGCTIYYNTYPGPASASASTLSLNIEDLSPMADISSEEESSYCPGWYGTLESIDVSQIVEAGLTPIVYVSPWEVYDWSYTLDTWPLFYTKFDEEPLATPTEPLTLEQFQTNCPEDFTYLDYTQQTPEQLKDVRSVMVHVVNLQEGATGYNTQLFSTGTTTGTYTLNIQLNMIGNPEWVGHDFTYNEYFVLEQTGGAGFSTDATAASIDLQEDVGQPSSPGTLGTQSRLGSEADIATLSLDCSESLTKAQTLATDSTDEPAVRGQYFARIVKSNIVTVALNHPEVNPMPFVGGPGTVVLYTVGLNLALIGGAWLVLKRKRYVELITYKVK